MHDENYWKEKLTPEQYEILRNRGTERPFSGKYLDHDEKGMYKCAACGAELFSSDTKYESTTIPGWPSFSDVLDKGKIKLDFDDRYGMRRTEIKCANCDSHLGHLFDDGPSREHYCVNSCALDFEKK